MRNINRRVLKEFLSKPEIDVTMEDSNSDSSPVKVKTYKQYPVSDHLNLSDGQIDEHFKSLLAKRNNG